MIIKDIYIHTQSYFFLLKAVFYSETYEKKLQSFEGLWVADDTSQCMIAALADARRYVVFILNTRNKLSLNVASLF